MTDADREIITLLEDNALLTHSELSSLGARHIRSQAAEIERLKQQVISEKAGLAGERLGTIAALRHQLADSDAEITHLQDWQQRAVPWLPKCGTSCQCQGEHDCELKVLRSEAAVKGEGDG